MECSAESLSDSIRSDSSVNVTSRNGLSRFSILCGFVMLDVYWLYLTFLSHVMNPVSVFVVDSQTGLHLLSGQIGSLAVTVAWSEVWLAVLLSLFVFALATLVADAAGKMLANSASASSSRLALATRAAA
ncbi:MAG: hypothetical protein WBQ86_17990 [Candidatus Binatus sp.]